MSVGNYVTSPRCGWMNICFSAFFCFFNEITCFCNALLCLMHRSLPHNTYCCLLLLVLPTMCMLHLVICTYFNSSPIAPLLLFHDHVSRSDVVVAFFIGVVFTICYVSLCFACYDLVFCLVCSIQLVFNPLVL